MHMEHDLARDLFQTIKSVAHDFRSEKPKRYTYEEWSHFTKLVRFSRRQRQRRQRRRQPWEEYNDSDDDDYENYLEQRDDEGEGENEEDDGDDDSNDPIEWDWIGEGSPMLADITEAEWVLDRLCESLNRYTRRQAEKVRQTITCNPISFSFSISFEPRGGRKLMQFGWSYRNITAGDIVGALSRSHRCRCSQWWERRHDPRWKYR